MFSAWSRYTSVGVLSLLLGCTLLLVERAHSSDPEDDSSDSNGTTSSSSTFSADQAVVYSISAVLVVAGVCAIGAAYCILRKQQAVVIVAESAGVNEVLNDGHDEELGVMSVENLARMGALSDADYLPSVLESGSSKCPPVPSLAPPSCTTASFCDASDMAYTETDDTTSLCPTPTPSSLATSLSQLPPGMTRPPRRMSRRGSRPRRHSAISRATQQTSEATQGLIFTTEV